jgi:hypothetical protein
LKAFPVNPSTYAVDYLGASLEVSNRGEGLNATGMVGYLTGWDTSYLTSDYLFKAPDVFYYSSSFF